MSQLESLSVNKQIRKQVIYWSPRTNKQASQRDGQPARDQQQYIELAWSQFELPVEVLWWITSLPHWTWLLHWPGINISHHCFTEPKTFWQNEKCCVRLSRTKWKVFNMGLFYLSMHQETSKKVSASLDTFTHYVSTWLILQLLRLWRMEKGKLKVASCIALNTMYRSQTTQNLPWKPFSPQLPSLDRWFQMTYKDTVTLSSKRSQEVDKSAFSYSDGEMK